MDSEKRTTAPNVLIRALELFDLLAENPPMSVIEISKALGVTRPTVYSLTAPLQAMNYIEKDDATGKFRLGYKFLEIGRQYRYYYPFVEQGKPFARALAERTGCDVSIKVLKRNGILISIYQEYAQTRHAATELITETASLSSCGKVLLAALDDDELQEALRTMQYLKLTERSITDPDELYRQVMEARKNGYAVEHGEGYSFRGCIAMPIRSAGGKVLAAMSVSGELNRIQQEHDFLLGELSKTVGELSRVLGWNGTLG